MMMMMMMLGYDDDDDDDNDDDDISYDDFIALQQLRMKSLSRRRPSLSMKMHSRSFER